MKRKPLVYIAGEAVELPSNQGLDFDDSNFVHITGQETITGMKTFDVPPRSSFTIENPNDSSQKIPNTAWVQQAILAAKTNTLIYKGIINNTHPLPDSNYEIGWVYKVAKAGDYAGQPCEVWDTIVCVATNGNDNDWYVIQANIDGYVTGPSEAIDGNIVLYEGTTGKFIKDSGKSFSALQGEIDNKVPIYNTISPSSARAAYWDTTPTSGSTKPVTSGGIFAALANKIGTYSSSPNSWDTTPTDGSPKPVTSDGIHDAIAPKLTGEAADSNETDTQNASKFPTVAYVASMIQTALGNGEEEQTSSGFNVLDIDWGYIKPDIFSSGGETNIVSYTPMGMLAESSVASYNSGNSLNGNIVGHEGTANSNNIRCPIKQSGMWLYLYHQTGVAGANAIGYSYPNVNFLVSINGRTAQELWTWWENQQTVRSYFEIPTYSGDSSDSGGNSDAGHHPAHVWVLAFKLSN